MLVKVRMCTICRSDIHSYLGHRPNPTPGVLGHEIIGTIVSLGAGRLLVHLGMTGQFRIHPSAAAREPHTHLSFDLGATQLRYRDERRFALPLPPAFAQFAAQIGLQLGRAGGEPGDIGQRQFVEPQRVKRPGIATGAVHLGHIRATLCRNWERLGPRAIEGPVLCNLWERSRTMADPIHNKRVFAQ